MQNDLYEEITYLAKKIFWKDIAFPEPYEPLREQILAILGGKGEA